MGLSAPHRPSAPARPLGAAAVAVAVVLLSACATTSTTPDALARAAPLGPLQVALLYHQASRTAPPPELALAWPEPCQVRDPEAQAAAVRAAAPRLAGEAARVAATDAWRVQVRQALGPYDLQRGGFRTMLKAGAVIRFEPHNFCFKPLRYLLAFRNGDRHALLPLDEAEAKELLRRDPSREVTLDMLVEPVATQLDDGTPVLVVDITRLRITDGSRAVVLDSEGR